METESFCDALVAELTGEGRLIGSHDKKSRTARLVDVARIQSYTWPALYLVQGRKSLWHDLEFKGFISPYPMGLFGSMPAKS